MQNSLRNSEWILVFSLILIMGSLFLISKMGACLLSSFSEGVLPKEEFCSVAISGAVKKPGKYCVQVGAPLKKIIQKAKPNHFADLKKFNLDQRVEDSMEVHIDELWEIKIRIEGLEEKSVEYSFPRGTRLCDLKVILGREGDRLLKGRRLLKDGEILDLRKK